MIRELTCIICPRGCTLRAEIEEGRIVRVTGNACPRGEKYAHDECLNPQRTVTSTMRCVDGRMISVKTSCPIPKDKVFECMKLIDSQKVCLPIHIGDVIIENVFGSNIVATSNLI